MAGLNTPTTDVDRKKLRHRYLMRSQGSGERGNRTSRVSVEPLLRGLPSVFPNDLSSEVRGVSSESDRSSARRRSSGPTRGSFRNALWLLDGHPASYTKELIDDEPTFASPDSSKGPSRFRSPSLYPHGFRKPMPAGHRR